MPRLILFSVRACHKLGLFQRRPTAKHDCYEDTICQKWNLIGFFVFQNTVCSIGRPKTVIRLHKQVQLCGWDVWILRAFCYMLTYMRSLFAGSCIRRAKWTSSKRSLLTASSHYSVLAVKCWHGHWQELESRLVVVNSDSQLPFSEGSWTVFSAPKWRYRFFFPLPKCEK